MFSKGTAQSIVKFFRLYDSFLTGQFPNWHFPDEQFPNGHFFNWDFPEPYFSPTEISPTEYFLNYNA